MQPMKAMKTGEHPLGYCFETDQVLVFFGDRRSSREAVAEAFAQFRILTLKQTHSNIVIASPYVEPGPEADAHFTHERQLAICIRTADCIPVMIHDPDARVIAAIHAGWRGVENEIIVKTCARLKQEGASLARAKAWIGPHIGAASFEVGRGVGDSLELTFQRSRAMLLGSEGTGVESPPPATSLLPHADPEKIRVDLLEIARTQLRANGISLDRQHTHAVDTFTSQAHESHRRDHEKAGRQISFIVLK